MKEGVRDTEWIILVDEQDNAAGRIEKMQAHQLGLLHRAFSVFIFNSKGELLLQQRADHKYHSAGLWSNTCCSHPHYGEELEDAVKRRLKEEMGMQCGTRFAFHFIYRADFGNGLIEHEFDHVFFGTTDDIPDPQPEEVKAWKYIDMQSLKKDLDENPHKYTAWLAICFDKVKAAVSK